LILRCGGRATTSGRIRAYERTVRFRSILQCINISCETIAVRTERQRLLSRASDWQQRIDKFAVRLAEISIQSAFDSDALRLDRIVNTERGLACLSSSHEVPEHFFAPVRQPTSASIAAAVSRKKKSTPTNNTSDRSSSEL
jgi:hypothetical protein